MGSLCRYEGVTMIGAVGHCCWEDVDCLKRQLAAANERAWRLEANLRSLCERLDKWWYEADPMGDVNKGERHPWTVAARKALEVPDAL